MARHGHAQPRGSWWLAEDVAMVADLHEKAGEDHALWPYGKFEAYEAAKEEANR
jgi:hypothetical protein